MKNVTKILLTLIVGVSMLGLISCDPPGTTGGANTFFTYKNETQNQINLFIQSINSTTNDTIKDLYGISPGNEIRMYFVSTDYQYPLCLDEKNPTGYVNTIRIERKGFHTIKQTFPEGLYNIENYKFLNPDDIFNVRYYEFTFTEDFFTKEAQ